MSSGVQRIPTEGNFCIRSKRVCIRRLSGAQTLLAARLVTYACSGAAVLFITRVLGPFRYGVYAAGGAIAGLGLVLSYFGQEQLFLSGRITLQELRRRGPQLTVLSVVLLTASCAAWPHVSSTVRICGLAIGLGVVSNRLLLPFFAEPSSRLDFRARAMRELLVLASWPILGAAIGMLIGGTPVAFAAGYAIAGALPFVAVLAARRKQGAASTPFRVMRWDDLVAGLPYAFSNALYLVYFQSDIAVLGALRDSRAVGIYAAACSVLTVAIVPSSVLTNDVARTRLYKERVGSQAFRDIALRAGRSAALLGVISGGIAAAGSSVIMRFLFGSSFADGARLLEILGIAICLYYWSNWTSNVLIAAGRKNAVVVVQFVLALGNVAFNVVLIPHFGAAGSAVITGVCEGVGLTIFGALLIWARTLRVVDEVACV